MVIFTVHPAHVLFGLANLCVCEGIRCWACSHLSEVICQAVLHELAAESPDAMDDIFLIRCKAGYCYRWLFGVVSLLGNRWVVGYEHSFPVGLAGTTAL